MAQPLLLEMSALVFIPSLVAADQRPLKRPILRWAFFIISPRNPYEAFKATRGVTARWRASKNAETRVMRLKTMR